MLAAAISFSLASQPHLRGAFSLSFWKSMFQFGQVMLLVQQNYHDRETAGFEQLTENALRGMLQGLDRYSTFFNPAEFSEHETFSRQSYAGIGVEIRELMGRVTIMAVYPDSPADRSGLLPGDWFVAVDGEDVKELGIQEIVRRVRGLPGSAVELTMQRGDEPLTFEVERAQIQFSSVADVMRLEGDVGYLRLTGFGERTVEDVRRAVLDLEAQGIRGLIIDVRNNPGGLLIAARDLVDLFAPAGAEIVAVKGRRGRTVERFTAQTARQLGDYPVAILQNRFSASASEILAGSMQALGLGFVVGEPSLGKASVQSVFRLEGGDGLSFTTAVYELPDGRYIHESGVVPDIEIPITEEEIIILSMQRHHLLATSTEEFRELTGHDPVTDHALEQAVEEIIRRHLENLGNERTAVP